MRTVPEFYTFPPFDPFGSPRDQYGRTHRGADWWWPGIEGESIPSWLDGVVVYNDWYGGQLGYVVVVAGSGGWAGWSHLQDRGPLAVGRACSYGDAIGAVGNTGTASSGAHVHATFSTDGWDPGAAVVQDPVPWIKSAIKSMTNNARPQEDSMLLVATDAPGKYAVYVPGKGLFPLKGGEAAAIAFQKKYIVGGATLSPADLGVTYAEFAARGDGDAGTVPELDYAKLAQAIKESGALELVIAGTAKPA